MLVFVANYGSFVFHGVVVTFDAAVTTRGVGTCCEFVYTEAKTCSSQLFWSSLQTVASIFTMVW